MSSTLAKLLYDLSRGNDFYEMALDEQISIQRIISYLGDVFGISMVEILHNAFEEVDIIRILKHLPILNGAYNA